MKVEANDIQNAQKRLVSLKRRQNELVKSKEAEIKKIKESYNEEARYARQQGLEKVDQQRFNNQLLLENVINRKNEKLEEVKISLKSTDEFLKEEEQKLKDMSFNQQKTIRESNQDRLTELKMQAIEASEKSNHDLNETLSQIKSQSDRTIKQAKLEARQQLTENEAKTSIALSNNKMTQQKTLHDMQEQMNHQQDSLHKTHQEDLMIQRSKQEQEQKQRDQIYQDNVKATQVHQQDKLMMEKKAFQEKYTHMTNEHKAVIDRLTQTFQKQINDMSLAQREKVSLNQSKASDSFYRNNLIEPQISEDPTSYTLTLNVPEHEKDQFVISAHKRAIKLSFFRNYQDEVYEESGVKHSTKRTESLTRSFNVNDIVDPNKVTKTFKDNMLTFVIAKA